MEVLYKDIKAIRYNHPNEKHEAILFQPKTPISKNISEISRNSGLSYSCLTFGVKYLVRILLFSNIPPVFNDHFNYTKCFDG